MKKRPAYGNTGDNLEWDQNTLAPGLTVSAAVFMIFRI